MNSQSSKKSTVSEIESSSLQQSKIYEDEEESKHHSERNREELRFERRA